MIDALARQLGPLPEIEDPWEIPELPTLLDALAAVPDPRRARGRRYPFVFLLAVGVVSVLCGVRSLLGMECWIKGADPQLLVALGLDAEAAWTAPADSTLGRAFKNVDADALDDAAGSWLRRILAHGRSPATASSPAVRGLAFDGKVMRGAAAAGADQPHLVSVVDHDTRTVLGQRAVDTKSNEITAFAPTLDGIDLTDCVVTADALHTQRAHAELVHSAGGFYLFPVKHNQPGLYDAVDNLPWEEAPIAHTVTEKVRGRTEQRDLKVLPAPDDLPFPHAAQVLLIERTTTGRGDQKIHCTAELAVTSAPWNRADPETLSRLVRGQWTVETVHLIRDVTYREDASRVRTGSTPRTMATLRNLATSIISLMGWRSVTQANDHYRDHPLHALQAIGLTT
jgi:predicted transposase YbfD/YdcC